MEFLLMREITFGHRRDLLGECSRESYCLRDHRPRELHHWRQPEEKLTVRVRARIRMTLIERI